MNKKRSSTNSDEKRRTKAIQHEKEKTHYHQMGRQCYAGQALADLENDKTHLYQYTAIDECTREVFAYAYNEKSGESSTDFIRRLIIFLGFAPQIIQTDNGTEFTNPSTYPPIHTPPQWQGRTIPPHNRQIILQPQSILVTR